MVSVQEVRSDRSTFVQMHSSGHLTEDGRRREITEKQSSIQGRRNKKIRSDHMILY